MGSIPGNKTEEVPLCVLGSQEWHRRMGREEWERPVLESWTLSTIISSVALGWVCTSDESTVPGTHQGSGDLGSHRGENMGLSVVKSGFRSLLCSIISTSFSFFIGKTEIVTSGCRRASLQSALTSSAYC